LTKERPQLAIIKPELWQAVQARQAMVEKNAIEALKRQAAKPIHLPSPEELTDVAYNVEKLAVADPALGREELRKMFDQGHIALLPQPDTMQSGMASVIKRLVRSSAPGLR
jgi:hypothetical protein